MAPIYVLHGPNLNLLGKREPHIYGTTTLAQLNDLIVAEARRLAVTADCRQTNHEGQLVDWIQEAREHAGGLILNASAYTHTSIAIFDALSAVPCPVIEVHLTNIFKRETFRHHSYVSQVAKGVICGLGPRGYTLALTMLAELQNDAATLAV